MLQQLYYIEQHVGAHLLQNGILKPYISLLRKITVVVLHGVISVYSYIAHLFTFRIQNNYSDDTHVFTAVIPVPTPI